MCMCRAFRYVKLYTVKCLCPDRATDILPSLLVSSMCKITKKWTLLPVHFKTRDFDTDLHGLHVFIYLCHLDIGARKMEKILEYLLKISL